ncbi:hypothetical protein MRX96_058136 [Rhipicephalus microplus]
MVNVDGHRRGARFLSRADRPGLRRLVGRRDRVERPTILGVSPHGLREPQTLCWRQRPLFCETPRSSFSTAKSRPKLLGLVRSSSPQLLLCAECFFQREPSSRASRFGWFSSVSAGCPRISGCSLFRQSSEKKYSGRSLSAAGIGEKAHAVRHGFPLQARLAKWVVDAVQTVFTRLSFGLTLYTEEPCETPSHPTRTLSKANIGAAGEPAHQRTS